MKADQSKVNMNDPRHRQVKEADHQGTNQKQQTIRHGDHTDNHRNEATHQTQKDPAAV